MAKAALLTDRAAIRVAGPEAAHFLHNLVTNSVDPLPEGAARHAALLTPQGKIIADFLVLATSDGFLLDVAAARVPDLLKRLTLYRLRAKVTLAQEPLAIAAIWDAPSPPALPLVFADPRLDGLGFRAFLPIERAEQELRDAGFDVAAESDFHAHRVAHGVPEGGRDFAFDDAFPHEAMLDQLGGIDFRKGCYIGQEVVSRMQHRGTARTRIVPVTIDGEAASGAEIVAGERAMGTLGSVAGDRGLALLRLDRAEDAMAASQPITAGRATLNLQRPAWAKFRFPGDPAPEEAAS